MMLRRGTLFIFWLALILTMEIGQSFSGIIWRVPVQKLSSRDAVNREWDILSSSRFNSNPSLGKQCRFLPRNNLHRRINNLRMGGYYSEPYGGRKLEYDHMIFGLPCRERKINLTLKLDNVCPDDEEKISFIVLNPVEEEAATAVGGDENVAETENATTWRLAQYLVAKHSEFVLDKRVLVLGSSNWIGLLATRLGARDVMVWDSEKHETRLRLLEHMDKFLNRRNPRQKCTLSTFTDGEALLMKNNENEGASDEYIDIDLIIFATEVTPERADAYIHDFVRRTDAKVLMNQDLIDAFGYYTRINEGVDVHLW